MFMNVNMNVNVNKTLVCSLKNVYHSAVGRGTGISIRATTGGNIAWSD